MNTSQLPAWLTGLETEDVAFMKNFILASGSLKEIARVYGVSYPTVRLRLDRLIQKIELNDRVPFDPYVQLIKSLAVDEKLDYATAKLLIDAYQKEQEKQQ